MMLASIQIPVQASGEAVEKHGQVLRSHTARVVLAVASVVLLFLSSHTTNNGVQNMKDLSDNVVILARQLQRTTSIDEQRTFRDELFNETLKLERQLEEKDIELAWEQQHLENQIETQKIVVDTMAGQIERGHGALEDMEGLLKLVAKDSDARQQAIEAELARERRENEELRRALAVALEQLSQARAELTAAAAPTSSRRRIRPDRAEGEIGEGARVNSESKLRGAPANLS